MIQHQPRPSLVNLCNHVEGWLCYTYSLGLIGSKYIHEVLPQESKYKVYSEGM